MTEFGRTMDDEEMAAGNPADHIGDLDLHCDLFADGDVRGLPERT